MKLKKYDTRIQYSYTFGAFPTIELIKNKPELIQSILVHSDLEKSDSQRLLYNLCKSTNILLKEDTLNVEKLRDKENIFVIGVFKKFRTNIDSKNNHIVLVNPSDMGNSGTIMRTGLGFGYTNFVFIKPCIDIFNPKVIRASMGAIFQTNIVAFNSLEDYINLYPNHVLYPFMLNGKYSLDEIKLSKSNNYSLIFGNESTGLDNKYLQIGKSVFIPKSNYVDSYNLSIAVGIAMYYFNRL